MLNADRYTKQEMFSYHSKLCQNPKKQKQTDGKHNLIFVKGKIVRKIYIYIYKNKFVWKYVKLRMF